MGVKRGGDFSRMKEYLSANVQKYHTLRSPLKEYNTSTKIVMEQGRDNSTVICSVRLGPTILRVTRTGGVWGDRGIPSRTKRMRTMGRSFFRLSGPLKVGHNGDFYHVSRGGMHQTSSSRARPLCWDIRHKVTGAYTFNRVHKPQLQRR